ncbi:Cyclin-U4-1, partial [Cucurbita argyrosperma subsp. argyrosperma]
MVEEESSSMMPKLITFLSSVLQRVAESNDDLVDDDSAIETQKNSAFHGLTRPSISLHTYLERIFKYANCSNSCFIVAYVYLDRFAQRQPLFPINSFNVHRLLITRFHLNVTPNTFHTYCSCLHKEMLQLKPPLSNSLLTSSETSLNKASHLSFEEDEASHHQNQHQLAA